MLDTAVVTKPLEIPVIEVTTLVTIHIPNEMDVKMWRKMELPEGWKKKPYYPKTYRGKRAEFYITSYEALKRLQEDNELMRARLLLICK